MIRFVPLFVLMGLVAAACSASDSGAALHETPEQAVVAWFEAVDSGDADAASDAVHSESLVVILAIENDVDATVAGEYFEEGVPIDVHASYWESFSAGFSDFASRPVSTLTVGQAAEFVVEGQEFASVPISGGPSAESIVFARRNDEGSWEVDMVATLGDGFSKLLLDWYRDIPESESGDVVRVAYVDAVVPALWAAVTEGTFGDEFNRLALAVIAEIDGEDVSSGT